MARISLNKILILTLSIYILYLRSIYIYVPVLFLLTFDMHAIDVGR